MTLQASEGQTSLYRQAAWRVGIALLCLIVPLLGCSVQGPKVSGKGAFRALCAASDIRTLLVGQSVADVFPETGSLLTSVLKSYRNCEISISVDLATRTIFSPSGVDLYNFYIATESDGQNLVGCIYTELAKTIPPLLTEHCLSDGSVTTRPLQDLPKIAQDLAK